jgi:hypothetical protein
MYKPSIYQSAGVDSYLDNDFWTLCSLARGNPILFEKNLTESV